MNSPWVKILLFGLLFAIGGFLVGRCCGHCGRGGCGNATECRTATTCAHGPECTKAECGKGHGMCMHGSAHGEAKACCKGGHDKGQQHDQGEGDVHAILDGLRASDFQGDTIITINGGTVKVERTGDRMEVKVEMSDSTRVMEKTVEMH